MAVRVRMFAALRDAAGAGETTVEPAPLQAILDELSARYGEPFATRLRVASVLVDGASAHADANPDVADDAEVALLPPFSGGSVDSRRAGPNHHPPARPAACGVALA